MLIRYLSDLHLEFIKPEDINDFIKQIPINNNDEICILAGDIGNPYQSNYYIFMDFINNNFKKSFVIAGNHEYYNNNINDTNIYLKEFFSEFKNISFLNNSYEYYEGYYFVGSILWSKIIDPRYKINDIYKINNMNFNYYNELNKICIDFLEETVYDNTIIITHHMPSESLIDIKYKTPNMMPYNQYFYSNMDNFIERNKDKIKCWIYGHTHSPNIKLIHDIPFLCNPIGYPNENTNIDFNKTYTLI
jgi:predicted phosphohydrolase